jgi:hypothetical protein
MPRTRFNGKQFVCPECGWQSEFPEDFIKEYKAKWGLDKTEDAYRAFMKEAHEKAPGFNKKLLK